MMRYICSTMVWYFETSPLLIIPGKVGGTRCKGAAQVKEKKKKVSARRHGNCGPRSGGQTNGPFDGRSWHESEFLKHTHTGRQPRVQQPTHIFGRSSHDDFLSAPPALSAGWSAAAWDRLAVEVAKDRSPASTEDARCPAALPRRANRRPR